MNKSYESRVSNLEGLRSVILKGRSKLCEAMKKDLNKSEVEAYYTEMNLVEHEIQHMVDHLKSYMSPQSVSTDLLNIGGASAIYPDPLGVVCVIGAWNYPVQLTLMPCVGAIAAGNVCLIKVSEGLTLAASPPTQAKNPLFTSLLLLTPPNHRCPRTNTLTIPLGRSRSSAPSTLTPRSSGSLRVRGR